MTGTHPASSPAPTPPRRYHVARPKKAGSDLTPSRAASARRASFSAGRVNVFVRIRPLSQKELAQEGFACVEEDQGRHVFLSEFCEERDYLRRAGDPPGAPTETPPGPRARERPGGPRRDAPPSPRRPRPRRQNRIKCRSFTFDHAFGPESCQPEVYSASTSPLVDQVLLGRNACCFCYGATGAGKTHTMLGTPDHPGVMIHALRDLFRKAERAGFASFDVKLSYLEVYNEAVRDLLSPGKALDIREGGEGTVIPGLTQFACTSADEVIQLLHQGNQRRTTEETRCNATSSRSHAVLQVYVAGAREGELPVRGKLSLIDLAGSERHLATEARSQRSVEGANINKSLLALSSCISALVEGKRHIPFRNSKLTKLLKDSLGGQCLTSMIANVSPSSGSLPETSNTLHWADRAKQITAKEGPPTPRLPLRRPQSAMPAPGAPAPAACARCDALQDSLNRARQEIQRLQDSGAAASPSDARVAAQQAEELRGMLREAVALGRRQEEEKRAAQAELARARGDAEGLRREAEVLRRRVRELEATKGAWRVDMSLAGMPPAGAPPAGAGERGGRGVTDVPVSPAAMGSHPVPAGGSREGSLSPSPSPSPSPGVEEAGGDVDMYEGPYALAGAEEDAGNKAGALRRLRSRQASRRRGGEGELVSLADVAQGRVGDGKPYRDAVAAMSEATDRASRHARAKRGASPRLSPKDKLPRAGQDDRPRARRYPARRSSRRSEE